MCRYMYKYPQAFTNLVCNIFHLISPAYKKKKNLMTIQVFFP